MSVMYDAFMRTTVTLDPDVEQAVRERMSRHGVSFKRALNDAIRAGLIPRETPVSTRSVSMGAPRIDVVHALRVAADLEDDEVLRKVDRGA